LSGITGRLSNPKKSAFLPEGKMNKAGSCTAASASAANLPAMADLSAVDRNSTVLRFGAPGA
jgi:hypothetical protein